MKNPPDIYQLETDNQSFANFNVDVSEDLPFFPGHFPQQSVLPGVVMLDWVVQYAEQLLPVSVDFTHMEAIKFKQVICPPLTISFVLKFNAEKQKLTYSISSEKAEHSSGRIAICKAK